MRESGTQDRPGPTVDAAIDPPLGLLAELTHRCPLSCPYCSNPANLDRRSAELDTATWKRVFSEAADLGVMQVHLSGGEPTSRSDIVEITAHCRDVGLYTNLITSGINVVGERMDALAAAGLDHVQISFQGDRGELADHVSGMAGSHARKLELAAQVTGLGLPLTVNAVIHRGNADRVSEMVQFAIDLGARRIEIAHVQYYGWALRNRDALMPTADQVHASTEAVKRARADHAGQIVIDAVVPDYYARRPKPCVGGWGKRSLNVSPAGKVLPCHAAETIPHLTFPNVRDTSLHDIWHHSAAFNAYRGTDWMAEPCRSCDRRDIDFGGCRCQALAMTGDAAATDPACALSPFHARMVRMAETAVAEVEASPLDARYDYRRFL